MKPSPYNTCTWDKRPTHQLTIWFSRGSRHLVSTQFWSTKDSVAILRKLYQTKGSLTAASNRNPFHTKLNRSSCKIQLKLIWICKASSIHRANNKREWKWTASIVMYIWRLVIAIKFQIGPVKAFWSQDTMIVWTSLRGTSRRETLTTRALRSFQASWMKRRTTPSEGDQRL